jgi:hypothetical protein
LENPLNLPVVNHKDENKCNNEVENLEWCTVQYNTVYKNSHLRRSVKLMKPIRQLTLDGELVQEWRCRSAIENCLGYCGSAITACCLGYKSAKTAYGYRWEYIKEVE